MSSWGCQALEESKSPEARTSPLPRCHLGDGSVHPGPGAAKRLALSHLLGLIGAMVLFFRDHRRGRR